MISHPSWSSLWNHGVLLQISHRTERGIHSAHPAGPTSAGLAKIPSRPREHLVHKARTPDHQSIHKIPRSTPQQLSLTQPSTLPLHLRHALSGDSGPPLRPVMRTALAILKDEPGDRPSKKNAGSSGGVALVRSFCGAGALHLWVHGAHWPPSLDKFSPPLLRRPRTSGRREQLLLAPHLEPLTRASPG